MTKRINVNPDHYKVAGRERPGNATTKSARQTFAVNREAVTARARAAKPRRTKKNG